MTGQAEIERREGKRGGLWHGRRKNFPGRGNKVSLQRPWAGKKPDTFKEGQEGCLAVNKKEWLQWGWRSGPRSRSCSPHKSC